jgi:hypothetical protein
VVPLAMLYLYGPRNDRAPDLPGGGWRPRYLPRAEAGWIAAIPGGLLAYLGYLAVVRGDPLAAFTAQAEWERVLAPLSGVALGVWSAASGIVELAGGFDGGSLAASAADSEALLNIALLGFLVLAGWLTAEAARRLPAAYLGYVISSLALPLSVPVVGQPLMSLPRFMLVAFPLWVALALWALERGAVRRVLAGSAAGLVATTALFAGWVTAP